MASRVAWPRSGARGLINFEVAPVWVPATSVRRAAYGALDLTCLAYTASSITSGMPVSNQ
jgi:hypothetical protein